LVLVIFGLKKSNKGATSSGLIGEDFEEAYCGNFK
jgi:hypothetical protein